MKLKKITIHNIASIADAEISFLGGPLRDAPLFLITGPTGAGKSIILDAVCLALYAQTPRMTRSASNEKYEEMVVDKGKRDERDVKVNSNSQLMRRSTGECFARLLFEGNDGHDYEAQWMLQRANRRVSGKMQQEKRTLTRLDTGETWAKKADVDERIAVAVGLKFEQFCRTTLLAQGEFTRFLQSKSDEKSEILERLTGIDIYSVVGRKIADHTREAADAYDRLKREVEGIKLLTEEEKTDIQAAVTSCQKQIADLKGVADGAEKKRKWMADAETFQRRHAEAERKLARITESVSSEEFVAQQKLVEEYECSESARVHLSQCDRALARVASIDGSLPQLIKNQKALDSAWQKLKQDVEDITKAMEEPTAKLLAVDRASLSRRQKSLYEAQGLVARLADQRKTIAERQTAVDEGLAKIEASRRLAPDLKAKHVAASKAFDEVNALYAQMETSVGNAARELRRQLVAGGVCPVCGSRVVDVLPDEHFQSVLEPVRRRKAEAEERKRKAETDLMVAQREYASLVADADKNTKSLTSAREALAVTEKNAEAACAAAGVAADLTAIGEALADVNAGIQAAAELQKQCDVLRKRYDDLCTRLADAADDKAKIEKSIELLRGQQAAASTQAVEAKAALAAFYDSHENLDEKKLRELSKMRKEDIDSVRSRCREMLAEAERCSGAVKMLAAMMEQHMAVRPELADGDTPALLAEQVERMRDECDRLLQDNALRQQRLDDDRKKVAEFATAMAKKEDADKEWQQWDGLYKLLGDADGKRFRMVAQSFILSHLLNIANGYLKRFTDRYTLTCQPGSLIILVVDTHCPGAPQSANVLSGGESFMVSLSLALALSRLNSADTGVDTLFIDEGFGTLSDECLTNVMDTLETLHQMGGRRVGIISHVDELSSRIQVQVQVERADVTRSEVTVVDTCGYGY